MLGRPPVIALLAVASLLPSCGAERPTPETVTPEERPAADDGVATTRGSEGAPADPPRGDAPPVDGEGAAEMRAELATLPSCRVTYLGTYEGQCAGYAAFAAERAEPMLAGAEDVLLEALGSGPGPTRAAAAMRLARQPGPRTTDADRALAFVERVRGLEELAEHEHVSLGRAAGAVDVRSERVRSALRELVQSHSDAALAAKVLAGMGASHPRDGAVLDIVDSFSNDPRPEVRVGALDAYADTRHRDPARACAAWHRGFADPAPNNRRRAEALVSVVADCRAHHPELLDRIRSRSPDNLIDASLVQNMCAENDAIRRAALPVAESMTARATQGDHHGVLMAIARCQPTLARARAAMRGYARRGGEWRRAAERALRDLDRE